MALRKKPGEGRVDDEAYHGDLSKSRVSNILRRIQAQWKYGSRIGLVFACALLLFIMIAIMEQRKERLASAPPHDLPSSSRHKAPVMDARTMKELLMQQKQAIAANKRQLHLREYTMNENTMSDVQAKMEQREHTDLDKKDVALRAEAMKETTEDKTGVGEESTGKQEGKANRPASIDTTISLAQISAEGSEDAPQYLLVDLSFGTLSQRIVTLCNALVVAKRHDLILVMPPVFKEPGATIATLSDSSGVSLYPTGTYIDHGIFATGVKYILMDDFMQSKDGKRFTGPKDSNRDPVPFFMASEFEDFSLKRFYRRDPWNFNVVVPKGSDKIYPSGDFIDDICMVSLHRADYVVKHCQQLIESKVAMTEFSCRLVLMDNLFTDFRNCSMADPWTRFLSKIHPNPQLKSLVNNLIAAFRVGSFIVVELHHSIEDDRKDGDSQDKFFNKIGERIKLHLTNESSLGSISWKSASYYIVKGHGRSLSDAAQAKEQKQDAVEPHDMHSPQAFQRSLKQQLGLSVFVDHASIVQFMQQEMKSAKPLYNMGDSYFFYGMIELWSAVEADIFIGRAKSSFGFLVASYRQFVKPDSPTFLI